MKRLWIPVLLVALLCVVAVPKAAYALWTIEHYYYSDYFVTEVGWDIYDYCGNFYDSGGTTDGAYMVARAYNCEENGNVKRCYRKEGGEWVELFACPPGV